MFDWFWEFLFKISCAFFRFSDLLVDCAKVLLGIDPVTVDGGKTDFLTYLITSEQLKKMFGSCVILAFIALIMFTIFAILKSIAKEQGPGASPATIGKKAFRSFMTFLLVPTIMIALIYSLNTFMNAIYQATMNGSTSIGAFLFAAFGEDAKLSDSVSFEPFYSGELNYWWISHAETVIKIKDFDFIMSWIVGWIVLKSLGETLVSFVERAISIMILYIAAPFTVAASVLDDGARFKQWREKVLVKFLSAYGTLIAINFYILLCALVSSDSILFFADTVAGYKLLNRVAKILIILGGSLTMKKTSALVADLLAAGGGADLNDPAGEAGRQFAGKAFGAAMKYNPVGAAARFAGKALKGAVDRKLDNLQQKLGNSMLNKLGIDTSYDTNRLNGNIGGGGGGADNNKSPDYNNDKQQELKDALENGEQNGNPNDNDKKQGEGNDMVNNAIKQGDQNQQQNNDDKKEG